MPRYSWIKFVSEFVDVDADVFVERESDLDEHRGFRLDTDARFDGSLVDVDV